MKRMRVILGLVMALALCVVSSACAEVAPKKKGPSTTAYERANDKANFKRTAEVKDKTAKKDIKTQGKSSEKKTGEKEKGKKKGFPWWQAVSGAL